MALIKVDEQNKELHYDDKLVANLDKVKKSVMTQGWDHASVVAGIPGAGKSTLAQQLCKYLDTNFSNDNICFTAKDFIQKTTYGNKGQAFMLDESFADMNSNLSRSPEFIALMNHIQLIRQRGLYLILVLPDFFSLNKNIAVFRTSYLFVVYAEDYKRGAVAVFDRKTKRELYIKGKPFLNYQAVHPNFRCRFTGRWLVDYERYEREKFEHLKKGAEVKEKESKHSKTLYLLCSILKYNYGLKFDEVEKILNTPKSTLRHWAEKGKEGYLAIKGLIPGLNK